MGSPTNGLKNAPGEFQRFMEHCLDGLRDDICIPILMTSLYSAKHSRIVLTIPGKCLDGCVSMGLSLNQRNADSLSEK